MRRRRRADAVTLTRTEARTALRQLNELLTLAFWRAALWLTHWWIAQLTPARAERPAAVDPLLGVHLPAGVVVHDSPITRAPLGGLSVSNPGDPHDFFNQVGDRRLRAGIRQMPR